MAIFNLEDSDIIDLELKLKGEIPINRDELLALVNTWGRNKLFYTSDKNNNTINIEYRIENEKYDLSKLDVSEITNFDDIFKFSNFNGDINSWNVSKAISMEGMFSYTENFNSPLDKWNTSNVNSMFSMFAFAKEFNKSLDKWNTSNVKNLSYMFFESKNFNQNLNSWNISKVTNMNYIFACSKNFNQPVLWDLSKVEFCNGIFSDSIAFVKRFNKNNRIYYATTNIKVWLKENLNKMIAIEIEENKAKELDNFLLNLNVIDSSNLNGLRNSKGIDNGNI